MKLAALSTVALVATMTLVSCQTPRSKGGPGGVRFADRAGAVVWRDLRGTTVDLVSPPAAQLDVYSKQDLLFRNVDGPSSVTFWHVQGETGTVSATMEAVAHYESSDCTGPAYLQRSADFAPVPSYAIAVGLKDAVGYFARLGAPPNHVSITACSRGKPGGGCSAATCEVVEHLLRLSDFREVNRPQNFLGPIVPEWSGE